MTRAKKNDAAEYADDWRGECVRCGTESTQEDAACKFCGKKGFLSFYRETKGGAFWKGAMAWGRWEDYAWRCRFCGTKYKALPCPKGDGAITVPRVSALMPYEDQEKTRLLRTAACISFVVLFFVGRKLLSFLGWGGDPTGDAIVCGIALAGAYLVTLARDVERRWHKFSSACGPEGRE
jgi:hypothetical protein